MCHTFDSSRSCDAFPKPEIVTKALKQIMINHNLPCRGKALTDCRNGDVHPLKNDNRSYYIVSQIMNSCAGHTTLKC